MWLASAISLILTRWFSVFSGHCWNMYEYKIMKDVPTQLRQNRRLRNFSNIYIIQSVKAKSQRTMKISSRWLTFQFLDFSKWSNFPNSTYAVKWISPDQFWPKPIGYWAHFTLSYIMFKINKKLFNQHIFGNKLYNLILWNQLCISSLEFKHIYYKMHTADVIKNQ